MPDTVARRCSRTMELRTTEEKRSLITRAVAASGTDLTEFAVTHASLATRRVLAGRRSFQFDTTALAAWEELNARSARHSPAHTDGFRRSSPFVG